MNPKSEGTFWAAAEFLSTFLLSFRGALEAGLRAIQVKTGNYRADQLKDSDPQPTGMLASFAELPAWLAKHNHQS